MFERTVRRVKEAFPHGELCVVTQDDGVARTGMAAGADHVFRATCIGLNAELEEAARLLRGKNDMLVLHADLPLLKAADLWALNETPGDLVIAPDDEDAGTNAVLMRGTSVPFVFGTDSFRRFTAQADARGLKTSIVRSAGLAHDLDTPSDLALLGDDLDALLARLRHPDGKPG